MKQEEFRNNPGEVVKETIEQDAAVHEQEEEDTFIEDDDSSTDVDEQDDTVEVEEKSNEANLQPKQKDAFVKRMEAEKRKLEEKLRADLEAEYEAKYSKHKSVVQLLGGDAEKAEKAIREANMLREADSLAKANGWNEAQRDMYLNQQKKDAELQELRVTVKVNELDGDPKYSGIKGMKQAIISKINEYGGKMSVEEAYWAIGGAARATQLAREAEQRAVAKRSETKRTVQSDSAATATRDKPLPREIEEQRRSLGMSEQEARTMLKEQPRTLSEWRKSRQK